jgi:hypothetical protein
MQRPRKAIQEWPSRPWTWHIQEAERRPEWLVCQKETWSPDEVGLEW